MPYVCIHSDYSPALTVIVTLLILPRCNEAETWHLYFHTFHPTLVFTDTNTPTVKIKATAEGNNQTGEERGRKTEVHLTLRGDLARANKVTLITDKDDGSLGLSLPQEKSELSSAVETTPVSHWKDQDTHLTQQSRQVLRDRQRQTHSMLQYCSFHLNILSVYL